MANYNIKHVYYCCYDNKGQLTLLLPACPKTLNNRQKAKMI